MPTPQFVHVAIPAAGRTCHFTFSHKTPIAEIESIFITLAVPPAPASLPAALGESLAELDRTLARRHPKAKRPSLVQTVAALSQSVRIFLKATDETPGTDDPFTPLAVIHTESLWPQITADGRIVVRSLTQLGDQDEAANLHRFIQLLLEFAAGTRNASFDKAAGLEFLTATAAAATDGIKLAAARFVQRPHHN